ncbi:hypothetical protein L2E82_16532 [Cichorium intybus]|uniref:Uncharacterized protein n=1 Tax=Cichorium intybus TaxID=13427 RepID=A0ACB9F5T4_CICIN|nr:hypothetical protein L2E82_16532 [Cichorium intybus]
MLTTPQSPEATTTIAPSSPAAAHIKSMASLTLAAIYLPHPSALILSIDNAHINSVLKKCPIDSSQPAPFSSKHQNITYVKEMEPELGITFEQAKQFYYEQNKVLLKEKHVKVGDEHTKNVVADEGTLDK